MSINIRIFDSVRLIEKISSELACTLDATDSQ
jgi:hypothetical protein